MRQEEEEEDGKGQLDDPWATRTTEDSEKGKFLESVSHVAVLSSL